MATTEVERLVYTIAETANLLSLSRGLAYQLAREGRLPTIRLGERRLVVPRAALLRMLEGNNEAGHENQG